MTHTVTFYVPGTQFAGVNGIPGTITLALTDTERGDLRQAINTGATWFTYHTLLVNLNNCSVIDGV